MITSLQNVKIKHIKQLMCCKKYRLSKKAFVIENERFIFDVFKQNPLRILSVFYDEDYPIEKSPIHDKCPSYAVTSSVFQTLHDVKTSSGLLAIAQYPDLVEKDHKQRVLLLDGIQNPANLGAIFRSASAFHVDHIYCLKGTTDPFHPESVRAMAGQYYTVPFSFVTLNDPCLLGVSWFQLDAGSSCRLSSIQPSHPWGLLIGSETGFRHLPSFNITPVSIPMREGVESLNVVVATSIALFTLGQS